MYVHKLLHRFLAEINQSKFLLLWEGVIRETVKLFEIFCRYSRQFHN